jgi:hypothetical protein
MVVYLSTIFVDCYSQISLQDRVPYIEFATGGFTLGWNEIYESQLNLDSVIDGRAELLCTNYFHDRIKNDYFLDSILNKESVLTNSDITGIGFLKPKINTKTNSISNTENTFVIQFLKELSKYYLENGGQKGYDIQIMSPNKTLYDSVHYSSNLQSYYRNQIKSFTDIKQIEHSSFKDYKQVKVIWPKNIDYFNCNTYKFLDGQIVGSSSGSRGTPLTSIPKQGSAKVICMKKEGFNLILCSRNFNDTINFNKLDCVIVKDSTDIDLFIDINFR